jgi:hypothetical protein
MSAGRTRVLYLLRNYPLVCETYIQVEIDAVRESREVRVVSRFTEREAAANVENPAPWRHVGRIEDVLDEVRSFRPRGYIAQPDMAPLLHDCVKPRTPGRGERSKPHRRRTPWSMNPSRPACRPATKGPSRGQKRGERLGAAGRFRRTGIKAPLIPGWYALVGPAGVDSFMAGDCKASKFSPRFRRPHHARRRRLGTEGAPG